MGGKEAFDGKTIGLKGRLTDAVISKLTTFYGNAIRANSQNVNEMRHAVWAHTSNADDEPRHWFCPKGKNSWCIKLGRSNGENFTTQFGPFESKNQEINRLQLAVKLPWAIFFESVDILSDQSSLKDTVFLSPICSVTFTCRNCGGGDRGRVAIYRPFGEVSLSLNRTVTLWCSRPTTGVSLALATMNFVGLVLTTSDRWH
ncbi:hypothetical protein TNCV_2391651 [Trichonephila clavipes]|nr:hypothetical protein TNCV_2391651 [Trichonephila clavipes]